MTRSEQIIGHLEQAAIDGGFRLTCNTKHGIVAHDLHNEIKPFVVSFSGGRGKDPFGDLKVVPASLPRFVAVNYSDSNKI